MPPSREKSFENALLLHAYQSGSSRKWPQDSDVTIYLERSWHPLMIHRYTGDLGAVALFGRTDPYFLAPKLPTSAL